MMSLPQDHESGKGTGMIGRRSSAPSKIGSIRRGISNILKRRAECSQNVDRRNIGTKSSCGLDMSGGSGRSIGSSSGGGGIIGRFYHKEDRRGSDRGSDFSGPGVGGEDTDDEEVLEREGTESLGRLPSVFSKRTKESPFCLRSERSLSVLEAGICDDANECSDWEAGVSVIDSILDPNSQAYRALSKDQREKLKGVQRILLKDSDSEDVTGWAHVPRNVKEANEMPMRYLRQTFSSSGTRVKRSHLGGKLRQAVLATSVLRNLVDDLDMREKLRAIADEHNGGYLPREWLDLEEEAKERLKVVLSWDNLCRWDFNVFELDELTGGQPLLFIGWAILGSPCAQIAMSGENQSEEEGGPALKGYGFCDMFKIPQHVLCEFIRVIEGDYVKENPYHNAIHAADVTQTTHALLQMGGVHYGADLEIFSVLLAAIIHDVGHPGYNNAFQVHDKTSLALIYNDKSVLENMHVSHAFTKLMGEDAKPDHDVLAGMTDEQRDTVRQFTIEAVLHTDMTTHFATVDSMKGLLVTKSPDEIRASDRGAEALWYMLHLADISNPAKLDPMFELWTDRCLEEFFRQGDKEKELGLPVSPLCDRDTTSRAESQIGFIQYVVKPSFEVLRMLLPEVGRKVLPVIGGNLVFWRIEEAKLREAGKAAEDKKESSKDEEVKREQDQAKVSDEG